MKKVLAILLCLVLSLAIVLGLPIFFNDASANGRKYPNEYSLVNQNIIGRSKEEYKYYKLYYKDKLVGVIHDIDYFNDEINKDYHLYEDVFPNSSLGLIEDCYITDEISNILFENVDDRIVDYCKDDQKEYGTFVGIKTTSVEFSDDNGIYEIIYITNQDLFSSALNKFLENFISNSSLEKIRNNVVISSPTDFGSVDVGLKIAQKMNYSESIVSPEKIFTTEKEIYEFLCYGRNQERQYYETKVGDTVQAVGYYFGDMTSKQVMMLNPDVILNEDQILAPGTKLNVTYYQSPIEVYVTKQRLAQESLLPETPIYREDNSLEQGTRIIEVEEENGLRNVLYKEIWVNGVIQSGEQLSFKTVKEATQGVIKVGTMIAPSTGTGNWRWPVDNPIITCNYVCYTNHGGTDFQNLYAKWDEVYAADSGIVEAVGYTDIGGYYVRIDHNNGYKTYYGHMRTFPYVATGQTVNRGEVLGPIGMTGVATGPHVHFAMYRDGYLIDPCSVMACELVRWG